MGIRLQRFVHSLATGYAVLGASAVYAFGSIPIALRYLTTEQFGVFALSSQLIAYLALIDFGMTPSIARNLIDVKDEPGDAYDGMVSTSFAVQMTQALLIAVCGLALAPFLGGFFQVSPELAREFKLLFMFQALLQALTFLTRIFDRLLYAHQRQYIINYGQIVYFGAAFAALTAGLIGGMGLMSLVLSQAAGWAASTVISAFGCWKGGMLPRRLSPRLVSLPMFVQIFNLGRDMFLVVVGAQLILASQVLVIGRFLGTEAGAVWTIATKGFFFGAQLLWRLFDYSMPALAEMMARSEQDRLRRRFSELMTFTLAGACTAGVAFAFLNQPFLEVWTAGKISWSTVNDAALGIWLVMLAYFHGYVMLIMVSKEIRFMRYLYLLEGLLCVGISAVLIPSTGISGMIVTYAALSLLLHGAYGIWRAHEILEVSIGWIVGPALRTLLGSAALSLLVIGGTHYLLPSMWDTRLRLFALFAATALSAALSVGLLGVSREQRRSVLARLSRIPKPA